MMPSQPKENREFSSLLDMVVRLDEIPHEGRKYEFSGDEEIFQFIQQHSNVTAISRFEGGVQIRAMRGGYEAEGYLRAAVEQQCVVTLEAVADKLDISLKQVYLRGVEPEPELSANGEVFVDLESGADNEWFEGDTIDLSDMIFEQYQLALNPYPKKQGASIPELNADVEDKEPSPFAVLSKLKTSE